VTRRATLLLVLAVTVACNRAPLPAPAQPAPQKTTTFEDDGFTNAVMPPIVDIDGDNLLNLAYGAAVVSRTGELNLDTSAANAIDGMSFSVWTSPPGGPSQTLTFALGAPSRVEQLGISAPIKEQVPEKVRFSASSDGRTWREITTMEIKAKGTTINEVKPFEARYLRIDTLDPKKYYTTITSVHALGREVRAPERMSFDGCWTLNSEHAMLRQEGARITGVIGDASAPTYVDGGVEGRVARLMWIRGPMWGYVALTLTPDARQISGNAFHEEPMIGWIGRAWLGGRCDETARNPSPLKPADYLRRTKHWTMSGMIFDAEERLVEEPSRGTLDDAAALLNATPAQRFRIVAQEHRQNDPKENLRRSKARIDAVRAALQSRGVDVSRIEFVAQGSERKDVEVPSAIQRMLWSRMDLEQR
jgi:hypothetical protein